MYGRRQKVGANHYWVADGSIFRNFRPADKFRLQFRAEAFNVLNHITFMIGDNTSLRDPLSGQRVVPRHPAICNWTETEFLAGLRT